MASQPLAKRLMFSLGNYQSITNFKQRNDSILFKDKTVVLNKITINYSIGGSMG